MNNKMATNTYQQMNLKDKLSNKRKRDRIVDMDCILMVAGWEVEGENGCTGEGRWVRRQEMQNALGFGQREDSEGF